MIAPPRPPSHDELEALIKEARKRQLRRRLLGAAGVAVAAAIGLGIHAYVGGGGPDHVAVQTPRAAIGGGSQREQREAQVSGLAYETSVLPGSGLQLASRRVGFALSWAPMPGIDGNLASPGGIILQWPAANVLVTRDGSRSWIRTLSARGGFWGLDVLDADRAWAVGVTTLDRTDDGGRSWVRLSEASRPLVRVAFANPRIGVGLTTAGALVTSRNGGASWQPSSWPGRGEAVCASGGSVLVADEGGGIWQANAGRGSWQRVAPGFAHVDSFTSWLTDLSCNGTHAVALSQALCAAACAAAPQISRIRETEDGGRVWHLVVSQHAGDPKGPGTHTRPPSALSLPLIRAAAASGPCLLGSGFAQASVEIRCAVGGLYRRAAIPRLPLAARRSSVAIQGFDFLDRKTGWLLLDEATSSATPSGSDAKTDIWTTNDGGRTWSAPYVSQTYRGRPCSTNRDTWCYPAVPANSR